MCMCTCILNIQAGSGFWKKKHSNLKKKQCLSYLLIRVSSTEDDVAEPLDAGSTYVGNT